MRGSIKKKVLPELRMLDLHKHKLVGMGFVTLLVLSTSGCATMEKSFINRDLPCEIN